jgi:hypothetical protein
MNYVYTFSKIPYVIFQQRKEVNKMDALFQQFTQITGSYIPRILGALAIFIIGWLVALILSSVFRNVLHRISLNSRLARWVSAEEAEKPVELEKGIAKGLFLPYPALRACSFFPGSRHNAYYRTHQQPPERTVQVCTTVARLPDTCNCCLGSGKSDETASGQGLGRSQI